MRALIVIGILALAAVGAGMMLLSRQQSSSDAAAGPATTTAPAPAAPRRASRTQSPASASVTRHVTPPVTAPTPKARITAAAASGDRLPAAIQQALASNHVVVIALYDPQAKVDDTALQEARAGAQLAGTTFVPIDVTQDDVAPLNLRYGVIQDPAVLVLRPPGDLVVRIDGFADRDTVAQAAANAAQ